MTRVDTVTNMILLHFRRLAAGRIARENLPVRAITAALCVLMATVVVGQHRIDSVRHERSSLVYFADRYVSASALRT
jgi:hypothetical protein